jgi:1-deoxy-D-xylulose-5-phosphate reductoisomerase
LGTLDFSPPDVERFRCLPLAYQALEAGGVAPIVLNAVNEVAVEAFLAGQLPFLGIPALIEDALAARMDASEPASLADVRAADGRARAWAWETIGTLRSSR